MLDEIALRRPDAFRHGIPVKLCDGQSWHFPEPIVGEYQFCRDGNGKTFLSPVAYAGDKFLAILDRYVETDEAVDQFEALFDAAVHLLGLNYDLTFSQAKSLLRRYLGDHPDKDANVEMWQTIRDVVMGNGPKPIAAGSEPSCEPAETPTP